MPAKKTTKTRKRTPKINWYKKTLDKKIVILVFILIFAGLGVLKLAFSGASPDNQAGATEHIWVNRLYGTSSKAAHEGVYAHVTGTDSHGYDLAHPYSYFCQARDGSHRLVTASGRESGYCSDFDGNGVDEFAYQSYVKDCNRDADGAYLILPHRKAKKTVSGRLTTPEGHSCGSTGSRVEAKGIKIRLNDYFDSNQLGTLLIGDWDGDGQDQIGMYNRSGRVTLLNFPEFNSKGEPTGCEIPDYEDNIFDRRRNRRDDDTREDAYETRACVPDVKPGPSSFTITPRLDISNIVIGDWDGDGVDTLGYWNKSTGEWTLYEENSRFAASSPSMQKRFIYNPPVHPDSNNANQRAVQEKFGRKLRDYRVPVAGNWTGGSNKKDFVGVVQNLRVKPKDTASRFVPYNSSNKSSNSTSNSSSYNGSQSQSGNQTSSSDLGSTQQVMPADSPLFTASEEPYPAPPPAKITLLPPGSAGEDQAALIEYYSWADYTRPERTEPLGQQGLTVPINYTDSAREIRTAPLGEEY